MDGSEQWQWSQTLILDRGVSVLWNSSESDTKLQKYTTNDFQPQVSVTLAIDLVWSAVHHEFPLNRIRHDHLGTSFNCLKKRKMSEKN